MKNTLKKAALSACAPKGARMEAPSLSTGIQGPDLIVQTVLTEVFGNTPELGMITTDFSAESVDKGASIVSRVYPTLPVNDFGTGGGAAQFHIVKVTIDGFKEVYCEFTSELMNCSSIDLIKDTMSPMIEGLKKHVFGKISALYTKENFPNSIEVPKDQTAWRTFAQADSALKKQGMAGPKLAAMSSDYWLKMYDDHNIAKYVSTVTTGYSPFKGDLCMSAPCNHLAFEVPDMDSSKLLAFSGTKASVIYVTRMPKDPTKYLPNFNPGIGFQTISVDLGGGRNFTGLLNFGIDKDLKAWMRLAWLEGVAVGYKDAGVRWVEALAVTEEEPTI